MTEEEKKQAEKKTLLLSLGILALLGVFLVVCFVTDRMQSLVFPVGVSVILAVYWAAADILPVLWTRSFEGKTEEQKQAYRIYALIDLAGLAGLVYFLVDLDSTTGAIIYVASLFLKKNFREKFSRDPEDGNNGCEQ